MLDKFKNRLLTFGAFIKSVTLEKGLFHIAKSIPKIILQRIGYRIKFYYYKLFYSSKQFVFNGKRLNYFYHYYGQTFNSERSIEIPIVWDYFRKNEKKSTLEVGNVLSHYFNVNYDIIDKYEVSGNVINEDVIDYNPQKKYDLVISISTLEHVGWDEIPKEPEKILMAFENINRLLNVGGRLFFTVPFGHNKKLDEILFNESSIYFTNFWCFKRISKNNDWEEVSLENLKDVKYGQPFDWANGIFIGEKIKK